MRITTKVISEVMGDADNLGIEDRPIGEILKKKEHKELMHKIDILRVDRGGKESLNLHERSDEASREQVKKKEGFASSRDYVIRVFKDPPAST